MKKCFYLSVFFVLFSLTPSETIAQNFNGQGKIKFPKTPDYTAVFEKIQKGILSGDISQFSEYISDKTFINLSSGKSGYYSVNQSYYILQEYFHTHKPVSFRFDSIKDGDNPFAIGTLLYENQTRKDYSQVFISLGLEKSNWTILQFSIK